jgi:hypothetical protein
LEERALHHGEPTTPLVGERIEPSDVSAGTMPREVAIEQAEAKLAQDNARLSRQLKRQHPELFDSDGQLIEPAYRRMLAERGGTGRLTRAEILRTDKARQRQSTGARSDDAS